MSVAQLFLTEAAGCSPLPRQVSMPFFLSYGSPLWLSGKESACNAGDAGSILESERSLEKEMATHSSILAWRIP